MATHHNIDLLLDLCEHGLVRDGDAFEDMMCCAVYWLRGAHEIYMCESTWNEMREMSVSGCVLMAEQCRPWLRYRST